ncbi:uncharacterized protein [Arachis hypogaea]|uniref:uncharacterized protein isoform X1 n=1 Tax=Arachis hypogaea TaxID=3818 RepID=UPI000DED27DB|nr:uncharacterized protein LOC112743219 isoform X2 [Arachis hypogaea]
MGLAGTVPQFSHSFRSCPILVNIVVIVLAASAVAGKTLPPPLSPKIAAESSVLLRVAVVLVTDCGVGVAETATSAAATWFPPRRWLGAEIAVVGDFGLRKKVLVTRLGYNFAY